MGLESNITLLSTRFLVIFIEALPFLLLGTLTSGLIDAFISHDDLVRFLPRHPVAAALVGGMMGLVFPVGECGVVPVVRRFFRKGLPAPASITFLLAAPVINPIVIASTYVAFHQIAPQIITLRIIVAFVIACCVGVLFAFQAKPERLLRSGMMAKDLPPFTPGSLGVSDLQHVTSPPQAGAMPANRKEFGPGLRRAITEAAKEFFEMGIFLALGSLLAASFRLLVTQHQLENLATNPVNSVLVMQTLAYTLSISGLTDAFVAQDFANTFTTGSILSFVTFGPMVDIKSTLMFLGVFRNRVVLYLILLPFLMSALIAIWLNLNVRF